MLGVQQLDGPPDTRAGDGEFRDAGRHRRPPHGAKDRRLADGHHHGAGLPSGPVFLADDVAMLARLDKDRERGLVMDLDPVGAGIDPVGVRVLGDHQAFGADVAATIPLVPFGSRKLEGVDVVPFVDVLKDRAGLDPDRVDGIRDLAAVAAVCLHPLQPLAGVKDTRGADIDGDPKTLGITQDIVE